MSEEVVTTTVEETPAPVAVVIPAPPEYIRVGADVMRYVSNDTYQGYIVDETVPRVKETDMAPFVWKGGRLQSDMLRQVLAFFHWVNTTHHTEATARFFYNMATREWAVAVLPQKICGGLSAKELSETDEYKEILRLLLEQGFENFGSIHSHCNISAFMSGTDERDERDDVGFHITLGCLNKDKADFHCRYSSYKMIFKTDPTCWIDGDPDVYLSTIGLSAFPEEWKGRMRKVEAVKYTTYHGSGAYGHDWGDNCTYYPNRGGGGKGSKGFQHTQYGPQQISSQWCKHYFMPGGFLTEDLYLDIYRTALENMTHVLDTVYNMDAKVAEPKDTVTNEIMRYALQYLIPAVQMFRLYELIADQAHGSRNTWRGTFNKVVSAVDTALDAYNPVYEILTSAKICGERVEATATSMVFDAPKWKIDLMTLIGTDFFDTDVMKTENSMLFAVNAGLIKDGLSVTAKGIEVDLTAKGATVSVTQKNPNDPENWDWGAVD